MPSMRQAAAMAGVSVVTLLRWNHRHGICTTRGGLNMAVGEAGLARLLHMAELIAGGMPEAEAAAAAKSFQPGDLPHRGSGLVAAARSMDVHHLDTVLSSGLASGTLADRLDDWLMPELRRVGEAWVSGDITPAQEEFVSAGTLTQLYACLREFPAATAGSPRMIGGLPAGEFHEIPVLATGVLLRTHGFDIDHLGANVDLATWERAAQRNPEVAIMSARTPAAARSATGVVSTLRRVAPGCHVWVGGRFADRVRGARVTPDRLGDAVRAITEGLAAESTPVA